jgi:HK97 family phage major capsid protein
VSQELKTLATEIQSAVTAMRTNNESLTQKMVGMQTQLDAIDRTTKSLPTFGFTGGPSALYKTFDESEDIQRLVRDRRGKAVLHIKGDAFREMQRKTVLTENVTGSIGSDTGVAAGLTTTGVLPMDRMSGITTEARQQLKIRDVLSAAPTEAAIVDFVKVLTPLSIASPVPEGSLKPEQNLNFTSSSERVKTLASFLVASRQILDDMVELKNYISVALPYWTNLEEELQILSGDNSGEDLHGIIPQAASFNSGLLPSAAKGWNKIDVIAAAIEQIAITKELPPTFVVLNPTDWWSIRLTKDTLGRYLLGDPQTVARPNLFGLDVVDTTSIASGTFLVGSGSPIGSQIRDRMEMTVEISTEHMDFFQRNLVAIRGEKRLAMVVKRPLSYVTGTFSTSP